MIKKIFGSGRVEELEGEVEELKRKLEEERRRVEELEGELEKEKKRAKEAITEKQETDRELKEAKHKIESLEDRIRNLEEGEEEGRRTKEVKFLPRTQLISLLNELESVRADAHSIEANYVESSRDLADDELVSALRGVDSETGFVHLKDLHGVINLVLVPPLPAGDEFYRDERFRLEDLREVLSSDLRVGFVSAHVGRSAVGVLRGSEVVEFERVRTSVKGKHSKGGFSQGRFERRRDEQIGKHLEELLERIEDVVTEPDYLVLDGNDRVLSELKDGLSVECPVIGRSLDLGEDAGEEELVEKVWGSRVYIF